MLDEHSSKLAEQRSDSEEEEEKERPDGAGGAGGGGSPGHRPSRAMRAGGRLRVGRACVSLQDSQRFRKHLPSLAERVR